MMSYDYPHPVSRTYQYKKITKPLLERKRRARINRCLDELKDLMVDALETEGDNISKLEKADILELTVLHLQRLQASRPSGLSTSAAPGEDAAAENRWRSGFGHCAAEACRFLAGLPGEAADRLARHLADGLQTTRQLNVQLPQKSSSRPMSPTIARPELVSPTLATLEKTANLLVPVVNRAAGNGITLPGRNASPKIIRSYNYSDNASGGNNAAASPSTVSTDVYASSCASPRTGSTVSPKTSPKPQTPIPGEIIDNTKTKVAQIVVDEEEEIDVEHVDENDPMWRPW